MPPQVSIIKHKESPGDVIKTGFSGRKKGAADACRDDECDVGCFQKRDSLIKVTQK